MNNIEINIHHVREIIAEEKWKLGTNRGYVKYLNIKTSDGTYKITLFGDTPDDLEIKNEGEYKE